jgi:hypothetical protein
MPEWTSLTNHALMLSLLAKLQMLVGCVSLHPPYGNWRYMVEVAAMSIIRRLRRGGATTTQTVVS